MGNLFLNVDGVLIPMESSSEHVIDGDSTNGVGPPNLDEGQLLHDPFLDGDSNLFLKRSGVLVPVGSGGGTYGFNTNGQYVKYPNGVLECWNTFTISGTSINGINGAIYSSPAWTWTYPETYIAEPVVGATVVGQAGYPWCHVNPSISNSAIRGLDAYARANIDVKLSVRAIGRWE
jgi:hypothetical protein